MTFCAKPGVNTNKELKNLQTVEAKHANHCENV